MGRKVSLLLVAVASALGASLMVVGPAYAAPPPVPSEPFSAPACAAEDVYEPEDPESTDPRVNALWVTGAQLDSYNAGNIVALYDSYGPSVATESGGSVLFPPVCAVRYVEEVGGPVSEWMYCTDLYAASCAEQDSDGNPFYREGDGDETPYSIVPLGPTVPVEGNKRTSEDESRLIAYLIQNGHRYSGTGYYDTGAQWADSSTTASRTALQWLIWCVSDAPEEDPEDEFFVTCRDSGMDAAGIADLIARIPADPVLTLDMSAPSDPVEPGGVVRVSVTSNVFAQPIAITGDDVTVCPESAPDAVLDEGALTISGSGAQPVTVELCVQAPASGSTEVAASVLPASTEHIGWNQASPLADPEDDEYCQVYATFYRVDAVQLAATATVAVTAATLPATGPMGSLPAALAATTLLIAGGVLIGCRALGGLLGRRV